MSFDLTNKNISDTFQNLLQKTGSDGRLYDLEGNKVNNLTIDGTLTANQYSVTSSVTNITTQEISGSTNFGNSSDDIHQFTGSAIKFSGSNNSQVQIGVGNNTKFGTTYGPQSLTVSGAIVSEKGIRIDPGSNGFTSTIGAGVTWGEFNPLGSNSVPTAWITYRKKTFNFGTDTLTTGLDSVLFISGAKTVIGENAEDFNPTETLHVVGTISASGDLIIGDLASGTYVSASSQGFLEISGSGTAVLTVDGHISASKNLAVGSSTVSHSVDGITVDGDISASGDFYVGDDINLTTTGKIKWWDDDTYIYGISNAILINTDGQFVVSDSTRIDLDSPAISMNMGSSPTTEANLHISGTIYQSGSGGYILADGDISSSGATYYKKNTFANDDATPSVAGGTYFETGTNTDTITTFDGGETGQIIYVISKAAITYDHDSGTLKCGTADLVTADGDLTSWLTADGTNWTLISFTDQSDDLS